MQAVGHHVGPKYRSFDSFRIVAWHSSSGDALPRSLKAISGYDVTAVQHSFEPPLRHLFLLVLHRILIVSILAFHFTSDANLWLTVLRTKNVYPPSPYSTQQCFVQRQKQHTSTGQCRSTLDGHKYIVTRDDTTGSSRCVASISRIYTNVSPGRRYLFFFQSAHSQVFRH